MSKQEIHSKIHFYSSVLLAFSLPFSRMMQLFIIFLMLNWIIEGDFKNKFRLIAKSKLALLFIVFYLLHVVGMLYTENTDSGLFDIQMKLTLLFFPMIYASRPIQGTELKYLFYAFIAGGIACALLMLGVSTVHYLNTGENTFFYEAFSFLIHPSYFAMYLNFTIIWMLFNFTKNRENFLSPVWMFVIIAFFSVIIVLLSSKMGLLSLIIVYIGFVVWFIVRRKKYLLGLTGLALIIISVVALLRFVPEISARVENAISAISNGSADQTNAESTAVRMLIWKAANEVIMKYPIIGAGTGDAKDELIKEYKVEGMTGAAGNNLNAHNEYYQVIVTLGVIGFIVFLLHLFLPLRRALRNKNAIYALFLLLVMFNFLTESMLETQAGVMFFALFNSLLCFGEE